jgi:hypothetical protein
MNLKPCVQNGVENLPVKIVHACQYQHEYQWLARVIQYCGWQNTRSHWKKL